MSTPLDRLNAHLADHYVALLPDEHIAIRAGSDVTEGDLRVIAAALAAERQRADAREVERHAERHALAQTLRYVVDHYERDAPTGASLATVRGCVAAALNGVAADAYAEVLLEARQRADGAEAERALMRAAVEQADVEHNEARDGYDSASRRVEAAEAAAAQMREALALCASPYPGPACDCAGCTAARVLAENDAGATLLAEVERLRGDAADHAAFTSGLQAACDMLRGEGVARRARVQALTAAAWALGACTRCYGIPGRMTSECPWCEGSGLTALACDLLLTPPPAAHDKAAPMSLVDEVEAARIDANFRRLVGDAPDKAATVEPEPLDVYPLGTILRYGQGETALMRVDTRVGGGWHARYFGRQCLGGAVGAGHDEVSVPSVDDLRLWFKHNPPEPDADAAPPSHGRDGAGEGE